MLDICIRAVERSAILFEPLRFVWLIRDDSPSLPTDQTPIELRIDWERRVETDELRVFLQRSSDDDPVLRIPVMRGQIDGPARNLGRHWKIPNSLRGFDFGKPFLSSPKSSSILP